MTITPEQLIEKLNEMKMTPEERKIAEAEKLGKQVGEVIANIMILLIAPTIIWTILFYIFALNITWLKVFGAYLLFNFFKNIIIKSINK